MTPKQCLEYAADYKTQAAKTGISSKRVRLLTNISRTYTGLASQLTMLADDMKADRRDSQARF